MTTALFIDSQLRNTITKIVILLPLVTLSFDVVKIGNPRLGIQTTELEHAYAVPTFTESERQVHSESIRSIYDVTSRW